MFVGENVVDNGKIIFRFYKNKIIVQVKPAQSGDINCFPYRGNKFYKIYKEMTFSEGYSQLISYIRQTNSVNASEYESICIFFNQLQAPEESLQEVIREADKSCGMTFSSYKFLGSVESFLKAVKKEMQKGSRQILDNVLFTDKKSSFLGCGAGDADSYFLIDADDVFHIYSDTDSNFHPEDYKDVEYFIDEQTFESLILENLSGESVKKKGFIDQYSSENKDKAAKKSKLSEMIERYGSVKTYSSR